jgi:hypothetical protein
MQKYFWYFCHHTPLFPKSLKSEGFCFAFSIPFHFYKTNNYALVSIPSIHFPYDGGS